MFKCIEFAFEFEYRCVYINHTIKSVEPIELNTLKLNGMSSHFSILLHFIWNLMVMNKKYDYSDE